MSAWDDIISKRLTPGTGPIGVKGIKPIHRAAKKCIKTVTESGRPRYICPASGGKSAVSSLENLPVKPEDVPEKTQQIAAYSPEQQFTPKQQREEPEKVKEAILKRTASTHAAPTKEAGPDEEHDHLHAKVPDEAGPDTDKDTIHHEDPKEAKGPSPNLKQVLQKIADIASEDEEDEGIKKSGPVSRLKSGGQARAKARAKAPVRRPAPRKRPKREKSPTKHKAPPMAKPQARAKAAGKQASAKRAPERKATSAQMAVSKLESAQVSKKPKQSASASEGPTSSLAQQYNLPSDYTAADFKPEKHASGVRQLEGGGFVIPGGNQTYVSKEDAEAAAKGNDVTLTSKAPSSNWDKFVKVNVPKKGSTNKDPQKLNISSPSVKFPKSFSVKHKGKTVEVDTAKPEFIAAAKTYSSKNSGAESEKFEPKKLEAFLTEYVGKTSAGEGKEYFKDFQQRKHDVTVKQAKDEKRGKFDSKLPKPGSTSDDLKPVDIDAYPGISESKSGGFKADGIDKMFGSADDAYEALHGNKPSSKIKINKEYGGSKKPKFTQSFDGGVGLLEGGGYGTPQGATYRSLAEAQLSLPKKGASLADKTLDQENWQAFKDANDGNKGEVKFPKTFKIRNSDNKIVDVDTSSKFFKNRVAQFWTPDRTRWQRKNYEPSETLGKYLKVAADGKLGEERAKNYKGPSIGADYGPGKRGRGVGRTKSQLDPGGDVNAPRTPAEKAEEKKFREFRKKQEAIRYSRRSVEAWEGEQKARNKRIAEDGYDKDRWRGTIGEVSTGELLSTIGNAALWVLPGGAYVKGAQAAARGGKALGAGAKALAGTAAIKSPKVLGRAIDQAVKAGTAVSKTVIAGKHVAQTVAHKGKTYALVGMIAHSSLGGPMRAVYSVSPTALQGSISMSVKAAPSAAKATGITAPAATQAAAKVAGKTAKTAGKTAKATTSTAAAKAADKAAKGAKGTKGSKIKAAAESSPQAAQAATQAAQASDDASTQAAQAGDEAGDEAMDAFKDIHEARVIQRKKQKQKQKQVAGSITGRRTGNAKRGAKRKKAKKRKRRGLAWEDSDGAAKQAPTTQRRRVAAAGSDDSEQEEKERQRRVSAAIAQAKVAHARASAEDPSYSRIGTRQKFSDIVSRKETERQMSKSQSFVAPFVRRVRNKSMSLKEALDRVPWFMQDDLLAALRDSKRNKRKA